MGEKVNLDKQLERITCESWASFGDYLFSNTKPAENDAQQIVGAELPGDRIQLILCKPQLFGEQIERLRILLCMVRGNRQMFPRRAQRNQVPLARQIDALRACLPPSN